MINKYYEKKLIKKELSIDLAPGNNKELKTKYGTI